VDAIKLVVFERDASGYQALRGVFVKMRGEEIVPAVARQLFTVKTHFKLLLKIVRKFSVAIAEQNATQPIKTGGFSLRR
jgi:hypothetical protein